MELLRAGFIDLVFANEDEAAALLEVLAAGGSTEAAAGELCRGASTLPCSC